MIKIENEKNKITLNKTRIYNLSIGDKFNNNNIIYIYIVFHLS
jgi:hypothetical protein